ncbi:MAG: hypothetical protein ACK5XN_28515 [Bacteroidota bacterium]|jgi:hypothetical protein
MNLSANHIWSVALLAFVMTCHHSADAEDAKVTIHAAHAKTAVMLYASVVELPKTVKARISFYEINQANLSVSDALKRDLKSSLVPGKYHEADPLVELPATRLILLGLTEKGGVLVGLLSNHVIVFRGCSPFTATAYQIDDRVFGEGTVRNPQLWQMLNDIATNQLGSKK